MLRERLGRLNGMRIAVPQQMDPLSLRLDLPVAAPRQQGMFAAQRVDAQRWMVDLDRFEFLRSRVNAFQRPVEALEILPVIGLVNGLPPKPHVPRTGRAGKERREQDIVQEDAGFVLAVELERAAMAGFDRTAPQFFYELAVEMYRDWFERRRRARWVFR